MTCRSDRIPLVLIVLLAVAALSLPALAGGKSKGPTEDECLLQLVDRLPWEPLSPAEEAAILFMREEEKLARDVYLEMDAAWGARIFSNIAVSEQKHMDAAGRLILKYGLIDPIAPDRQGVFPTGSFQQLFDDLVARGSGSFIDALLVGAEIEDLDIADLMARLEEADNADVRTVFQNLLKGSRNHLRSFNELLASNDVVYSPQFIDPALFESIVDSPQETGMVDADGNPLTGCGRDPRSGLKKQQRRLERNGR